MDRSTMRRVIWQICLSLKALLFAGCVSVNLQQQEIKRADNVSFKPPSSPYERFSADHVDVAWKNQRNGNSISFISDCKSQTDPTLEAMTNGIISDFHNAKVLEQKEIFYNERTALRSTVACSVDGVPSRFDVLVFKKNGCLYILSYAAIDKTYDQDKFIFDEFVKGFVAP